MAKAFPLRTLLDHARHRMEAAERLLQMIRRKEEQAKLKLEELERYQREYRERLLGSRQGGMNIHMMRDFHAFMAKLERAIEHQAREVESQHERWLDAHRSLLELRQKVKSYEVLEKRHATAELQRQERRDQRQSDELASLRAAEKLYSERH
jgi:flagellar FliJ protein